MALAEVGDSFVELVTRPEFAAATDATRNGQKQNQGSRRPPRA